MNPQSEDRVQSPEFWDRVVQLFHFALALGPTERVAYLRDAKATESDVVAEVESLICEHEQTGSFLDSPAYRAALEAANQRSTINLRRTGDDSQSLIGRVIGRYRVTRVIGRGGMGVVYLAHDASLGRNVALKLLPPEYTEDEERLRRFKHEARAASALNHPNILTVHELGEVEGIHFIAAEFVEGTTLRDRIRGQAMKLSDAVDVAVQVANALEAAHSAGIIHRDIKPENIMLRSDGIVKVLDFGIAKLVERKGMLLESEALTVPYLETTKGVVLGTPRYMSPEQTRGLALDGRTDIFSLGAVLYEIITGQSPFAGETLEDLRASILKDDPQPISHYIVEATSELQDTVSKALRKNREERYQNIAELAVDLSKLKRELKHESSGSMPVKITEDCIAEIRKEVLSARSLSDLRICLFRVEEFLLQHPGHVIARMLRTQIEDAIVAEQALPSSLRARPEAAAVRASGSHWLRLLGQLLIILLGVAMFSITFSLRRDSDGDRYGSFWGWIAIIGIGLSAIAYILIKYKVFTRLARNQGIESRWPRQALLVWLLCGIVIIGSYAFYLIFTRPVVKPIHSLAVLPLINASSDPDLFYYGKAITESIINDLSRLSALRVVPRTTAFRYKGGSGDPQKVGLELGVDAVLTGKVGRRGDTLTFQAELVSVVDGLQLWGERYNRKVSDILALQEEIANRITENLRIKLTNEERRQLEKYPTKNLEAYQLYLKGRYSWNKRTVEGFGRGIDYFNQAISKDRKYALAYAGLADSYNLIGSYSELPPKEAFPEARAAAIKALELDDTLAEAHASLADIIACFYWDWAEAEKECRLAIELNQNYAAAHQWYSQYLGRMGRLEEAVREAKLAQKLEPLTPVIDSAVAEALYWSRRHDEALQQANKTLELEPNFDRAHMDLGLIYLQKVRYDDAISEFQKARDLSGGSNDLVALLGYAYGISGNRKKALNILTELKALSTQRYVSPLDIALLYMGLGDKTSTFEWLEKAYEDRIWVLGLLKVEPIFDSLRDDSKFADLLKRVGLVP